MIGGAMSKRSLRIDVEVALCFMSCLPVVTVALPRMQLARKGLKFFFRTNNPEYFPLKVETDMKLSLLLDSQKIIDNIFLFHPSIYFLTILLEKLSTD